MSFASLKKSLSKTCSLRQTTLTRPKKLDLMRDLWKPEVDKAVMVTQ